MSLNAGARHVRVPPTQLRHAIMMQRGRYARISCAARTISQAQLRPASTSSTSKTQGKTLSASSTEKETSPLEPPTILDPLNPPATTRPPPLDLPARDPESNLFMHLFRLGKAYTTFYKTGLKAVFTNRKLVQDLPDTPPPGVPTPATSVRGGGASSASIAGAAEPIDTSESPLNKLATPTRSSLLLRARVQHDLARLPVFGLIVLICGEFTPIIVLLFPRLTPYTCRIPTQANVIRQNVESRRASSFRALDQLLDHHAPDSPAVARVTPGHVCRSLGLGSPLWDYTGFDVPLAKARASKVVDRIVQDDAFLRDPRAGGVRALVDDEVVLACEERAIDTLGKDVDSLREKLEAWVEKTAPEQDGAATDKVWRLLLGVN
ncbi:hypothetical protein F4808DRAFT_60414 [Astrocystis sublimbata]|nr:hypothetical protein F4808DRAFT_60414 [Astrocystis sublimbata]